MKKAAGVVLCLALMTPAVAASGSDDAEYRDDFKAVSYSGNDGSLQFAQDWSEFGDVGGSSGGNVHVGEENCSNNRCLHIEGTGLVVAGYGASRNVDLSMFEHVDLSFDVEIVPQPGLTNTDLVVEMHNGSKWTVVKTFDLSAAGSHHKEIDVTGYAHARSAVRFRVLDVISGGILGLDILYTGFATVDRVVFNGTLVSDDTPTSTTTPTSTSTSSPTTTSTTRPTTTTSVGATTTSTSGGGTATTGPGTPITSDDGSRDAGQVTATTVEGDRSTTTTSPATSTTTGDGTDGEGAVGGAPTVGPPPPPDGGLRVTAGGVIADYQEGMMGDMDMAETEVLGFEVTADFSMAVELFEAARIWIAGLALVIAAAIIGGLDRRRRDPIGR